ncbi:hypothetical protein [Phenylobacterium sp.]|uniref:hypothetical protein n=1 Tax=Phenylobacterium sp. TaxID=1871053 RepID=UPI002CED4E84|nr:hypothetical protein [Phenylobacterium sp.]HVI31893.1 hypothetical protein [Phenylobacterium sp.]
MSTQLVAQPGFLGRHVLLAGVVGACALGVGAGLWARPAADERRMTPVQARPTAAPKPAGRLEIVLDDSPAPIGAPIEVLPALVGQAPSAPLLAAPLPPVEATPLAPVRPPAGLVRVQAVEPLVVEPEPLPPPPKPVVKAAPKPETKPVKKAVAAKTPHPAEATAKAKKPTSERRVAKAEAAAKKARKAAKVRDEKPATSKLAQARPAKERTGKAAKAAEAKKTGKLGKALAKVAPKKVQDAAKTTKVKLAESRKARAEKTRLEKAKIEKARVEKARVEKAKLEKARLEKARVQKAKAAKARSDRAKVVKAAAPRPAPPAARPKVPKPTRDNPIRKASNRCASADPGEAIVCADPSLGAADRQLARAYRQAEAAGVSAGQLARQQQRWLAARAQAAREAPWAVRDVYEARIAELNDMTRGARSEY